MDELKICMGIWGNTNLVDRFNVEGFGEFVPVLDRIKQCGEIEGIGGFELHVPTEINESNAKDVEKIMKDYDLRMVQLCGHTWTEKQYKHGALAEADDKVRHNAIARVKEALDMGARFDVPISVLWPATDGNDFPMQRSYLDLYERYVDSVQQIMEYLHANNYKTKVCIEPKPFEPRTHIMMGTTAQALAVVNEVNDPNFGMNLDIGHALIAFENVEDSLSQVLRYGRLYHTHFNDNDMQCDADLPPGTVNFIRLVSVMYVLDEAGYDDWYGLDLFPYRDDPAEFITMSRDNLRLAKQVVKIMNEKGVGEMRKTGKHGPEISRITMAAIQEAR